jgi:type VI secretion system protein ImpH
MERATLTSASRDTALSHEAVEHLQTQPWDYGFLSLMRRIGASPQLDPIGTAKRPGAEPFRLGQQPSLTFAPREIGSVDRIDGRLRVRLLGLCMLGPNGSLPTHVTEIAREREETRHDSTLVAFLDVFHHRSLSLLYRAWANAQSAAGLDRPGVETEPFSFYIGCLTGQDPADLDQRALPIHPQFAASPHLIRESRDPDGLCMTLEQYFNVPVEIEEYVFHWIERAEQERSRLGHSGQTATMGDGAMLGEQVPDRQYRFRLVMGPLEVDEFLGFTPQGKNLQPLTDWVRSFFGYEFDWELDLRIRPQSAPAASLGGPQQLGWTTWLGQSASDAPMTGMRFEPERYMQDAAID